MTKSVDRKYGGYFPDEQTAQTADNDRLMNEGDSLDGTRGASESYRRDENELREMEDPEKTGAPDITPASEGGCGCGGGR